VLRANLAEREGRPQEAIANLQTAVERAPSWRNLYRLAKLEARYGRIQDARSRLAELFAGSPGNIWALQQLGEIELEFGDPAKAGQIYRNLIARSPQPDYHYLTNLGVAHVLLFQYEDAIAAFRQALAINPGHVEAMVDLAEAELALGHNQDAERHYRQVLRRLEKNRPRGGPSPADAMTEAQCLARLGRSGEAVGITQKALQQSPDNPDIHQAAALVYTLVGDRASALVNIQNALEKGIQPRWFTLPAYGPLSSDPEFRRLVGHKVP
jgi:tetratricopeptide (TPR) repeat protein